MRYNNHNYNARKVMGCRVESPVEVGVYGGNFDHGQRLWAYAGAAALHNDGNQGQYNHCTAGNGTDKHKVQAARGLFLPETHAAVRVKTSREDATLVTQCKRQCAGNTTGGTTTPGA